MTIKEAISASGLSKKTIYHYIEENLIKPKKQENGYFIFTEQDIKTLQHIRKLRNLGLSVSSIKAVLKNPAILMYHLFHLQKDLRETLALDEWRSACVSGLLNNLENKPAVTSLDDIWDFMPVENPNTDNQRLIDSSDAEFLVHYFWGNFVRETGATPYQQFLLEKLKQTIISRQDNNVIMLRDYLYDLIRNDNIDLFYRHTFYNEISALQPEQCAGYAEHMIRTIQKNVRNHEKMREWVYRYHTFVYPSVVFFDDPQHRILMREASGLFVKFQDNINYCCERVRSYLNSDTGFSLKQEILHKTQGHIDLNHDHSGEIAALYEL